MPFFARRCTVRSHRPNSLDHSVAVFDSPLCVIIKQFLRLRDCSARVAHRQFSGEYPASLSMRSIVCSFEGRLPMSLIKASKDFCQRVHTLIPLPPYCSKANRFGFLHLLSMPFHILYSLVFDFPCVALRFASNSFCKHPQLDVLPLRNLWLETETCWPQSQSQSQCIAPLRNLSLATTERRPNLRLSKSIIFGMSPIVTYIRIDSKRQAALNKIVPYKG